MFIIAILTWISFMAIPVLLVIAAQIGFNVIAFFALLIVEVLVFSGLNKIGFQLGDFRLLIALWVFFAICFIIIRIIKKISEASYGVKSRLKKLKTSANQGDAKAQFSLGIEYEEGDSFPRDYAEAVKWYRRAAEQGHTEAQFKLGSEYEKGAWFPQDYAEAVKWYRSAAEQGHAKAQFKLGSAYERGDGVPQDYAEAVKWYRSAASKGSSSAALNVGRLYMEGKGVPQDYAEVIEWLNKASQDEKEAKDLLAEIKEKVISEKLAAIPLDITWQDLLSEFEELRKKGCYLEAEAYLVHALKHENGTGLMWCAVSLMNEGAEDECLLWLSRGVELGWTDPMSYWASLLINGKHGVSQDYAEALKLLRICALRGHVPSISKLIHGNTYKYWKLDDRELEIYQWRIEHSERAMSDRDWMDWGLMKATLAGLMKKSE